MNQSPTETLPDIGEQNPKPVRPEKRLSTRKLQLIFVVTLLLGSFLAAFGGFMVADRLTPSQSTVNLGSTVDGNNVTTVVEQDVAGAAEKVAPSVVSIVTETQAMSYFDTTSEGAGTGVIVSSDGYVMTNKHVIEGTSTVSVVTSDGKTYENVKVVGTDPLNDVAFLKIENVSGLKPIEFGNSSTVRIGQTVIAIGNSLGQYQNTVTSGIISGTNRPVSAQAGDSVETLTDLIQTDAAINPGNSGGPLVNMAGQMIGINTAIATDAQGIGFAIPVNATKGMLEGLLNDGVAERAYLGVSYTPITPEAASKYNLSVDHGAYVYSEDSRKAVTIGSPADKAGVREKDIITNVNGVEVGTKGGVASLIGEYSPGDKIELTLLRDGKKITLTVTLGAYPG